ncbi:MAG: PilZ domain-containing protein [Sedimentisphaerales bacterium]|nr:PilZ domain-containing protein [Sedimentisphaerales bacterium]
MDLKDLYVVEVVVAEMISKLRAAQLSDDMDEETASNMRQEKRFNANLMGTLKRITDLRPGERKEWCINIQDISRSGMCFKVDTNFIPSRLVEITFSQPGGKIKQCFMEVVRMKKQVDSHGAWLEVGCRSVDNDKVTRLRLQEDRIARLRAKLYNKTGILILVIGPDSEDTVKVTSLLKSEDYQVKQMNSLDEALKSADRLQAQLAIFCEGSAMARNEKLLRDAVSGNTRLARLAILQDNKDSFKLFQAGIDECLMEKQVDEFLFRALERALVGHITRRSLAGHSGNAKAIVISQYNTWVNMLKFYLSEYGFRSEVKRDYADMEALDYTDSDLIFMDYDPESVEIFEQVCQKSGIPVIALCDDVGAGHQAMVQGGHNYLCMPPDKEDVRMILESTVAEKKTVGVN